ncbi:hypothetical protein [Flavobacterium davisii]|uniref:hypothetical protein n=1 Tax=Flavobacterium davisii TaxID=2906077 RepID=UPI002164A2B8|nr:hypothetical protein [Flavobacterium davisii]
MKKIILFLFVSLLLSCSNDKEFINLNTNLPTDVAAQDPTEDDIKEYFSLSVTSVKKADEIVNSITNIRGLKKIGYKQVDLLVENTVIEKKMPKKERLLQKFQENLLIKPFLNHIRFFACQIIPKI